MAKLPPKELLEQYFLRSLTLLAVANREGYFEYLNPSWSDLLGFSLEELKAKPFIEFVHPDDVESTINEAKTLLDPRKENQTVEFLNRYMKKDGDYVWLSWTVNSDCGSLIASAMDVTKFKEQQMYFESVQDIAKIGAWKLNMKDLSCKFTAGTSRIHGLDDEAGPHTAEEGIEYYTAEDQPKIRQLVDECAKYKRPYDDIFKFFPKNSKHSIWVRTNGVPVLDSQGNVSHLLGTFQDVTSQIKLLEDFEEKSNRLKGITQNAPGMVYQTKMDSKGNLSFPFVSQQITSIFGLEPE
ncbi:MAG: PAS domain-containing protein, partial [Pseudomonadota bacterium]